MANKFGGGNISWPLSGREVGIDFVSCFSSVKALFSC